MRQITCPVCGQQGTLRVFVPTGHVVVVHPGAEGADGLRWADRGCILSDRQRAVLADALETTGADLP